MKKLAVLLATFFGIGRFPLIPGTAASFVVTAACYTLFFFLPFPKVIWQIGFIMFIFLLGIPAASATEKHFQQKDPKPCVIDEVAGQLVGLLLVPHGFWWYSASFIFFRIFDIWKPFPAAQAEKLPKGLGIMTDDMIAGGYALAMVHLLRLIF